MHTLYILNGKWRVVIVACLASGKKHYLELQGIVEGIGPKMLSKELNKLELNGLITRSALETSLLLLNMNLLNMPGNLNR